MKMKKALVLSMVLAFASVSAFAQTGSEPARPSVFSDYLNPQTGTSFLRVPGLSFSTSAGFSYFSVGGAESYGMGYYMGHFGLKLSSSVSLNWDVGVGSVIRSTNEYNQPQIFLPNVDLTYRPNESFVLKLEYRQYRYPGYYSMFGR
ncbi:MAG: hypothetical protein NTW97_09975 [Candidatus Krumholzibacteria bacterium]|nr:hypothetical protein [Candidatus Krumholzibacteria bacterium]